MTFLTGLVINTSVTNICKKTFYWSAFTLWTNQLGYCRGASNISKRNVSIGALPTSLKKNRCSKVFSPTIITII